MRNKITFIGMLGISLLSACAKEGDFDPHLKNSQNPQTYLNTETAKMPILSAPDSVQAYKQFLNHYYSPWNYQYVLFSTAQIKDSLDTYTKAITLKPGYDENKHRHSKQWIADIISNMDIDGFPDYPQPAITIKPSNERRLPTAIPAFSSNDRPGDTYPFDNLQNSYLPANLPVEILHETRDRAWRFILTDSSFGWVKSDDLAIVSEKFIQAWQQNKGYIAFRRDNISVFAQSGVFLFTARMGAIYPIAGIDGDNYRIMVAQKNLNGMAVITDAIISKEDVNKIPLSVTPENVAIVAKRFINMPYGWGGLYGYRDCSATLKDIMSYFGIWLPRNSSAQATLIGKQIDLSGLSDRQKKKAIQQQGVPFLTLIHLPGHIMLYLGHKNGTIYVLHNMWGLRTIRPFRSDGRAVVGKTVITPIDFGKHYLNVRSSLLHHVDSLILLNSS